MRTLPYAPGWVLALMLLSGAGCAAPAAGLDARLEAALAGSHRDAGNAARDRYRHPAETLRFFGLEPQLTVVELWPGRGWYTEILAPVLRGEGKLIAASFGPQARPAALARVGEAYRRKLAADPQIYGEVAVIPFAPPDQVCLGPAGTADLVLTFRNLHNWLAAGALDRVFEAAYAVLRPGGVLGVVEHRGQPGMTEQQMADSGYLPEDYVVARAGEAGFELAARSEINANPDDTKDYPGGVWTLPPTLREGDKDRARYLAIGESDRMTLRFLKPQDGPPAATDLCPPG